LGFVELDLASLASVRACADALVDEGNGVTQEELIEALIHVTFYAGWPKGMAAMGIAKKVFTE
jgi:alkylhydroperoxidase/carboxymuconolactone decarboxylase family protein YurZ